MPKAWDCLAATVNLLEHLFIDRRRSDHDNLYLTDKLVWHQMDAPLQCLCGHSSSSKPCNRIQHLYADDHIALGKLKSPSAEIFAKFPKGAIIFGRLSMWDRLSELSRRSLRKTSQADNDTSTAVRLGSLNRCREHHLGKSQPIASQP